MKQRTNIFRHAIAVSLISVAVSWALMWFIGGVQTASSGYNGAATENLEKALRRGAAACYATEGTYPPNIDYLTEHYGIKVDTRRYAVFYEVFAENLMPEITVVES